MEDSTSIKQTREWVEKFIIGLNICPFARREMRRKTILFKESQARKIKAALADLINEISYLVAHPETETTLIIFPYMLKDFFDYLDFVDLAEKLLELEGYEGQFQLASFHPDYCFADTDSHDVANYTNRSPYPMLHLLREDSLDKAIAAYGDTSTIPNNNISRLRNLNFSEIEKLVLSSKYME